MLIFRQLGLKWVNQSKVNNTCVLKSLTIGSGTGELRCLGNTEMQILAIFSHYLQKMLSLFCTDFASCIFSVFRASPFPPSVMVFSCALHQVRQTGNHHHHQVSHLAMLHIHWCFCVFSRDRVARKQTTSRDFLRYRDRSLRSLWMGSCVTANKEQGHIHKMQPFLWGW